MFNDIIYSVSAPKYEKEPMYISKKPTNISIGIGELTSELIKKLNDDFIKTVKKISGIERQEESLRENDILSTYNKNCGFNPDIKNAFVSDVIKKYANTPEEKSWSYIKFLECRAKSFWKLFNSSYSHLSHLHSEIETIKYDRKEKTIKFRVIKDPELYPYTFKTGLQKYNLAHEALICLACTNKLRSKIPNFRYHYGITNLGPIIFDPETNIISYSKLSKEGEKTYSILENSNNTHNLHNLISKDFNFSPEKFSNIFLQVVLSLYIAFENYSFQHNNLKCSNVDVANLYGNNSDTIKKCKLLYPVPMMKSKKIVEIITNIVAVITGFEHSYAEIYREDFNAMFNIVVDKWTIKKYDDIKNFKINRPSNPLHDIYKFLLTCSEACFTDNKLKRPDIFTICENIFRFFNTKETLKNALQKQRNSKFFISNIPSQSTLNIMNFLNHLGTLDLFRKIITSSNENDKYQTIKNPVIETDITYSIISYYHLMKNTKDELYIMQINKLHENIDFTLELDKHIKAIDNRYNEIQNPVPLLLNNNSTFTQFKEVINSYMDIIKLKKLYQSCKFLFAISELLRIYKNPGFLKYSQKIKSKIHALDDYKKRIAARDINIEKNNRILSINFGSKSSIIQKTIDTSYYRIDPKNEIDEKEIKIYQDWFSNEFTTNIEKYIDSN